MQGAVVCFVVLDVDCRRGEAMKLITLSDSPNISS